jgi:hypothetical protein
MRSDIHAIPVEGRRFRRQVGRECRARSQNGERASQQKFLHATPCRNSSPREKPAPNPQTILGASPSSAYGVWATGDGKLAAVPRDQGPKVPDSALSHSFKPSSRPYRKNPGTWAGVLNRGLNLIRLWLVYAFTSGFDGYRSPYSNCAANL